MKVKIDFLEKIEIRSESRSVGHDTVSAFGECMSGGEGGACSTGGGGSGEGGGGGIPDHSVLYYGESFF